MADKQLRILVVGDASSVQKALKDTEQATATAQVKVEGFGKEFLKLGAAFGIGSLSVQAVIGLLKEAAGAAEDYAKKIDTAERSIRAITQSDQAVAQAQALANKEVAAGRAAYSDVIAAIDTLSPVAKRTGVDVEDLYRRVQLLAALNSGPEGGVEGAVIAISEALAGQWTSAVRRFNLPLAEINKLKGEGVPALQIFDKVIGDSGVTLDTLTEKSKDAATQQKIFQDQLARFAAEGGAPLFQEMADGLVALNKAASDPAAIATIHGIANELRIIIAGRLFEQVGLLAGDAFIGIVAAWNTTLKALSGGHVNIDGVVKALRDQLAAGAADLEQAANLHIAEPIASTVSGAKPGSPLAPAALRGYGAEMLANLVAGMTSEQSDAYQAIGKLFADLFKGADGETDTVALGQANAVLAAALHEVAVNGQVSERTTNALAAAYHGSSGEVLALVVAYGQLTKAQQDATAAAQSLADAQFNLQQVQNRAKGDLQGYQDAVDRAQTKAQFNADRYTAAIAQQQQVLENARTAAEAQARAEQQVLQGLQDGLDALQNAATQHAAARQAEIAAAQAQLSAASQQRSNDQALLNAALAGELEYEEQILDGLTDQQRAIAAKWQAEIDGQRRAKEGADQKVTQLNRAAHLEDQKALHEIDALRSSGHEKEARAAERALAARQKQRAAALTLAQADAAVANDQFDAAQEQVKKEGQDQEVKDTQAERAAQANLTRIQSAADAQKAADDAAIAAQQSRIKGVQDQQRAEQERSQENERNIQNEINKIQAQAAAQATRDKQAIIDATTLLTNQQTYWAVVTTGANSAVALTGTIKTNADGVAAALKAAYEWEQKRYALYDQHRNDPPVPAGTPGQSSAGGAQGGNLDPEFDPGKGSALPATAPTPPQPPALAGNPTAAAWLQDFGARGWGPALGGGLAPPAGYHAEKNRAGDWWVKDGYTINAGGTGIVPVPGGTPPPSTGGPGGLSRVGGLGESFQRASLGDGQQPAGTYHTTFNLHLPNVTNLGDERQRATMWREIEREWDDVVRGGHVKRDVG